MNELLSVLCAVSILAVASYYMHVLFFMIENEFETKKKFLSSLLPFNIWIIWTKKYYKSLGEKK